tara:strand:+ start:56 stop:487 length:432 start_codon:yes stop_codon:yes gene_type:complete
MEEYEKPLKQVNARIKRIVRQINAMTSDHYQRRAGGPRGSGDDLRQPTRGVFPDHESMLKAIDRFQEKGDPTPTEKSKVKKLRSRLNKLFRQKKVLEKKEGALDDKTKPYKLRRSQLIGRGGGGSMKMPQEYSKRSLLKKPMS